MEDIEKLVATSMGEIEKLLSTKSVIGEPITIEGNTVIPMMSIGFAFGAGGGSGKGGGKGDKGHSREGSGEGIGEGTGGVGGIKPVAVLIINQDGVKVESIKGRAATIVDKVTDVVGRVAEKRFDRKEE
ncbi:MAG: sporulation protein YtfJ [Chloroflexi bacterium]|jgi:uncharacterized spore protein YtfJ|nr:sporulation protein YtfJ [Chloroflexota bacterium]